MDIRDVVAGKYTKQEIFDFVVEKLRAQGCASFDGASLVYRGPNGTKCAIGHMVGDDMYDPSMEGLDLQQLFENGFLPDCPHEWVDFLGDIQSDLHDSVNMHFVYFPAKLERHASRFATEYNLTYTPPPENP